MEKPTAWVGGRGFALAGGVMDLLAAAGVFAAARALARVITLGCDESATTVNSGIAGRPSHGEARAVTMFSYGALSDLPDERFATPAVPLGSACFRLRFIATQGF